MKLTPLLSAAALCASLAACGQKQPEQVTAVAEDPNAEAIKNAPPVALPPAILATVSMRCKDNSLVSVTFFQGETQANLTPKEGATPVPLTAPAKGEAYAGGGYTLKGNAKSITLDQPGKSELTCKA